MKKILATISAFAMVFTLFSGVAAAEGGFDQYGYNEKANVFVGLADGVDRNLDGTVWGDAAYANDHLVMKWNEKWDKCNDAGYDDAEVCLGAWTSNEWNGMRNGTKSVWHYKIIWVGSEGVLSPYYVPGGYLIWGNYEVLSDHGFDSTGHYVFAHGIPNGYGN